MTVELINTGSELMLGRVLNSHQQWLCRQLADLGLVVDRQVAVPDTAPAIERAVREALARADLVITTGGLGPTSDDLTRECIARVLGWNLREDPETLARIQAFFAARNRPMPERTRVEALVPQGATILPNEHGTAPGLACQLTPNPFRDQGAASWLIMLPGPRRELHPMFSNSAIPLLQRVLPPKDLMVCRTLRTTGLGESTVQQMIDEPLRKLATAGLEIGYCARPGRVDIRLAARAEHARDQVEAAAAIVETLLGGAVFGVEDDELEDVVIRLLTERKETLALAESCTGGCIAHRLTNVPGASAVFRSGFVVYDNQAKESLLGVRAATLREHGAVSEPVAGEMAAGARRMAKTDYALAVTGIAGPAGGTNEKPVGTVFIALDTPKGPRVIKMFNPWDRLTFKEVTAQQALNLLRLTLQLTE